MASEDLQNRVDKVFVERGGLSPTIRENYGYNEKFLLNSMIASNADKAVQDIVNYFKKSEEGDERIDMVVAASGIGSFSIASIWNENVRKTWMFSEVEATAMLRNNVEAYYERVSDVEYEIMNQPFLSIKDIPRDTENLAIYLDFTWNENNKIGGKTLSQWSEDLSELDRDFVFMARYPKDKPFDFHSNKFTCSATTIGDDGRIILCSKSTGVKSTDIDKEKMEAMLRKYLGAAKATEKQINKLIKKGRDIWNTWSVDETINFNSNMHSYIGIGRGILRSAVSEYLNEKYKDTPPTLLMRAQEYYSSVFFADTVSKNLARYKLVEFFQTKLTITIDNRHLLIYSLLGAIVSAGNRILGKPYGTMLAGNLVVVILNASSRSKEKKIINSTTKQDLVKDFMYNIYADEPIMGYQSKDGVVNIALNMYNQNNIYDGDFLRDGEELSFATGRTSFKPAISKVYSDAWKNITRLVPVDEEPDSRYYRTVHGENFDKAVAKSNEDGFNRIRFTKFITDSSNYYTILLGFDMDGNIETLSEGMGYSRIGAERAALLKYL